LHRKFNITFFSLRACFFDCFYCDVIIGAHFAITDALAMWVDRIKISQ